MALDREGMRSEVRANISRTTGGVADSRINLWLDWAQERISDWQTFEEMRRIYTGYSVTDQKRYGFPSLMKDIYSLRLLDGDNSRTLIYVPARDFDSVIPQPTTYTTDRATHYVDYGVNFEMFPIPDAVYTLELRCSIYPIDFAGDASTSELTRKDKLIVFGASIFGFMSLGEYSQAEFWNDTLWPKFMAESLNTDHSAEDWVPVAQGFNSGGQDSLSRTGQYWRSPWVGRRR